MAEYLIESGKALIYYGLELGVDPQNKREGQEQDGYLKVDFRKATYYFAPGGLYVLNNTIGQFGSPDADMLLKDLGLRGLAKIDYDLFFGTGSNLHNLKPEDVEILSNRIKGVMLEAKIECYNNFIELIDDTKMQYEQRQLERQQVESGIVMKEKYEPWLSKALSIKGLVITKKLKEMVKQFDKSDFSKIEIPDPQLTPWTNYYNIPTPLFQQRITPVVRIYKEKGMAKSQDPNAAFEFTESNKTV
ncbi:MAG TPA: hypothetical protein ENH82_10470 [bacterium]|nr:hypothetical protein [bacterium]